MTAKSAFHIVQQADGKYTFASIANDEYLWKCENVLGSGIAFVFNYDTNPGNDHKFTIEPVDGGYKIKSYKNVYLGLGENNRLEKVADTKAAIFTFQEVSIIDDYVSIQNVETNNYVSFKDQENLSVIKVNASNITDDEKFMPFYTENGNYIMTDVTGKIKTVFFQSKSHTDMGIISATWQDGAVSAIVSKKSNAGGWESIVVQPNGDNTVSLRSSYTHQYITVNENNELALCDLSREQLTNREKFIIHSEIVPEKVENLTVDKSSRTQTTVDLSWTNPVCIYTGIQVLQKGPYDIGFTKIADLSDESGYQVNQLRPGNEYTFKLRFINGDETVSSESNEVTTKTRVGDKPATPTNVVLSKINNNTVKISWDKSENATHYQLQHDESAYAEYNDVENTIVDKDTTSIEVPYTDKYSDYYRIVAINNGEKVVIDDDAEYSDPSKFVSLEKNMFGDHTLIFAATDDIKEIDKISKELFEKQNDSSTNAQFNAEQYQVYFKPGDYTLTSCINLGFYTSINGLGKTPYDVKLNNIAIPVYLDSNNATCNFWRSAENLSIINTGNEQGKAQNGINSWLANDFNWAVAQAAPLRRVYCERNANYDWNYGWASGGYVADCYFKGKAGTWSGQQFYTRNSVVENDAFGTVLNNFYQGVKAPNLPNSETGNSLINGNGYSNWNIASDDGGQQFFTNVETTKKLSEKPFLYIDDNGEYQVFVPSIRKNTSGISWSESSMGEGKSIPLSKFYIAKPEDTAQTINEQIAAGKNIYFTPGTYHAEEPILVNKDNTILLGTGMASIIPDNKKAAMIIADDVENVKVAGLIFDAGTYSEYLLKVGEEKNDSDYSEKPIVLQDLFFRVGGTTDVLTKADNALEINSNDVIYDHFWIWRADHGAGVKWYGNESQHGLIVNGDDVTCYALFNEHFQKYDTLWNGENGATYFYQNEKCYDPISQEAWMTHNGTVNGYAAYKVANNVKKHYAVGLGIYNVFINTGEDYDSSKVQIQMDNAIEVPNKESVIVENACIQTFANEDGALQKFNHIINGVGDSVSSGKDINTGEVGEGWSRKFLISYQNGTAVVGKTTDRADAQKGKYIGVESVNAKQFGEEIDLEKLADLNSLLESNKTLVESDYTAKTWSVYKEALEKAQVLTTEDYLKYAANQKEFDSIFENYKKAIQQLIRAYQVIKGNEQTVVMGNSAEFTSNADFDKFVKVLVDDQELSKNDYSVKEGSTIVILTSQYIQTLTEGEHTLTIVSTDGQASTTFKVVKKDNSTNNNPSAGTGENTNSSNGNSQSGQKTHSTKKPTNTGDESEITFFATLGLLSAGAYTILRRKKNENS